MRLNCRTRKQRETVCKGMACVSLRVCEKTPGGAFHLVPVALPPGWMCTTSGNGNPEISKLQMFLHFWPSHSLFQQLKRRRQVSVGLESKWFLPTVPILFQLCLMGPATPAVSHFFVFDFHEACSLSPDPHIHLLDAFTFLNLSTSYASKIFSGSTVHTNY